MKTRTMALSLILAFTSSALFASNGTQNEPRIHSVATDTIPTDTIPTDSIPKTDTAHTAGTFGAIKENSENILKDNSGVTSFTKAKTASAILPSKESASR